MRDKKDRRNKIFGLFIVENQINILARKKFTKIFNYILTNKKNRVRIDIGSVINDVDNK